MESKLGVEACSPGFAELSMTRSLVELMRSPRRLGNWLARPRTRRTIPATVRRDGDRGQLPPDQRDARAATDVRPTLARPCRGVRHRRALRAGAVAPWRSQ